MENLSKRVDDEKYGIMLECHTPALDFYKEKYPVRLGWKKLLQLLPHFKNGAVEAFLAEVAPDDLAALGVEVATVDDEDAGLAEEGEQEAVATSAEPAEDSIPF